MYANLTDSELLVFCGLVRLLVRLDGSVSRQERAVLEQVGPELAARGPDAESPYRETAEGQDDGTDRFWNAMARAADAFVDGDSVRRAAMEVARESARQDIYAALYTVAASDMITDPEWSLLDWLSSAWELDG
ncbi:MAG: hypothetical protein ACOC1F_02635 [Myxococcota bacterium]